MKLVAIGLACLFAFGVADGARADDRAYVHIVRPGETLASIAQRYYGDPRRESVLVAENGLAANGGAPIVVGMRLVVPWTTYHRVQTGETWAGLATHYYGDPRRSFVLVEANQGVAGAQPDEGAELLVPYPLRHVASQSERLDRVSQLYYSDESALRRIKRFNNVRGPRLNRGQIVLVPLHDLTLSLEGRRAIEDAMGQSLASGEARALQSRIEEDLPRLRELVRLGRYTEAISLGNRLLGGGDLTGNQLVTIQRELGTAYVALSRNDLAEEAFRAALDQQPDLELDALRTSPVVRRAFDAAKGSRAAASAGAPDAGVP